MNKAILLSLVSVTFGVVGALGGCGGESDGDTADGAACFDYSTFDGTTPATTFKADVLPIFQRSCGLSPTCHGDPTSPVEGNQQRTYLGPPQTETATQDQIDAIMAANVNKTSIKGAPMKLITPGDPENSFNMHKMDGLCAANKPCEGVGPGSGCGETMPQKSAILSEDERNIIRRWIAQGAKND